MKAIQAAARSLCFLGQRPQLAARQGHSRSEASLGDSDAATASRSLATNRTGGPDAEDIQIVHPGSHNTAEVVNSNPD